MTEYEKFEYTAENRLRIRVSMAALESDRAILASILLFFLFIITLIACIACLLLGWPSWVSVFVKNHWIAINIVILVISIGLAKRSTVLHKISIQGQESDPDLQKHVNKYQKLLEIITYKAYVTDRANIPDRIFKIFVSGAIFGSVVFGSIFS